MQNIVLLFVLCLFCLSCAKTTVSATPDENGSGPPVAIPKWDPEERADIVVNPLFEAVVDNKNPEEIEKTLSQNTLSLYAVNKKGDTVLGTAIKLKNKDMALFLLEKFTCKDLSHQNEKGESYVYLSSKQGYEELIHSIAKKCFENSFLWPDYEFSDLDPKTIDGETAIHVALNGATAKALNEEYDRGSWEFSWFPFLGAKNNQGESFLHTAIRDNRLNIIEWALDTYCREGDWENSENELKRLPSATWHWFWNGLQGYTFDYVNIDQPFNKQDNQGKNALHRASETLNIKAITLILSCRYLDLLMDDKNENIALQTFLSALDPQIKNQAKEIKDTFVLMVHQRNYMSTYIARVVEHQNNKGDSSLHISARLSDPFFYNYLKKYGDIYLKNQEEQTSKEIFETTQNKIKSIP